MSNFGYAGKILRVDLSSGNMETIPTSEYSERFLGGRGFGAKVSWDEVSPEVGAFDEENRVIFATGPLCGLAGLSASRWEVCGKSAYTTPEHFNYCNMGGKWGAYLKFAGYDAIIVQGKSEKPVYLLLNENGAEIKDASALWGKGAVETREILKGEIGRSARIVGIGPAGENTAAFASLQADNDASGGGGLGATMGAKGLKAIVVASEKKKVAVADPERLRELTKYYLKCLGQRIMYKVDPVFHSRIPSELKPKDIFTTKMKQRDPCFGCPGCFRTLYEADDGTKGKFMCNSSIFYQLRAVSYYKEWNDVPFHATRLADTYGLDTKELDLVIAWLHKCYEAGILNDRDTGIPISKTGSLEFIETLVKKISFREGFGDILCRGLKKAAASVGTEAKELAKQLGHVGIPEYNDVYTSRLYTTHAIYQAMEPRRAMQQYHELSMLTSKWLEWANNVEGAMLSSDAFRAIAKRFWGSELAADFSTYEGKALAATKTQNRETAKECLILCDFLWPIMELASTEDHVGDPTLESKILSAVTGNEMDENGLYKIGARVYNLQRAILVREGNFGREFDYPPELCFNDPLQFDFMNPECLVPGKDGDVLSRKGAVLDRKEFEKMRDEYYALRQWDLGTGFQTRRSLEAVGLSDVVGDLEKRGLIGKDFQ